MEQTLMLIAQADPIAAHNLMQQGQPKETKSGIRYLVINVEANEKDNN